MGNHRPGLLTPWRRRALRFTMVAAVQFVVLTTLAMFTYGGGALDDPTTTGYRFCGNFFSDLGLTASLNGRPQPLTAALFFVALLVAGLGTVAFFVAYAGLFGPRLLDRLLATLGSLAGVVTGLGFIGVAFTPANLAMDGHRLAVFTAFTALPLAAACYAVVLYRSPRFPRRYGHLFLLYTLLAVAYMALIWTGPGLETTAGLRTQVAAQKGIVYASIGIIFLEAYGALRPSPLASSSL